jgi:putative ubiquitin-RnfH superfamily antitoxin RatB of RatAB toxin-antitoxin module
MADRMITVEVVHADAARQLVCKVELHPSSTVIQAIEASSIAKAIGKTFPDGVAIDDVGIFGRKVALDRVLADGDRIEIYRPLLLNPMEARRRRAR